jgi:hypothetical protein
MKHKLYYGKYKCRAIYGWHPNSIAGINEIDGIQSNITTDLLKTDKNSIFKFVVRQSNDGQFLKLIGYYTP